MKNKRVIIFIIVIIIVGVWFFSSGSEVLHLKSEDRSDVKLLEGDNNTAIIVSKDHVISVKLNVPVYPGGYQDPIISDKSVLSLKNTFNTRPGPNAYPGDGGTQTWQFKATKEGVSDITIIWGDVSPSGSYKAFSPSKDFIRFKATITVK